jgi:nucleoid-associated protein YgaU
MGFLKTGTKDRKHLVESGETLLTIAADYYGQHNANMGARLIYLHNEQFIPNINQIYPGMTLTIPYPGTIA